jgi:hypothetical protein
MQTVTSLSIPRFSSFGFWAISAAIAARFFSPATADASYLLLGFYALAGRSQAIQALALSWLFTMINPGLAPEAANAAIGRYVVLFSAALSVAIRSEFLKSGRLRGRTLVLTVLLGMFFMAHGALVSAAPDVSILKAFSWTLAMATLVAAWAGLTPEQGAELERWLFGFLVIVMLVSLPTILVPDIGYLRNGSGLQGILNHPQAFGPTLAILGAMATGRLLAKTGSTPRMLAILFGSIALILMSEARTAGVGLVLGVVLAVALMPIVSGKSFKQAAPFLQSGKFMIFIVVGLLALVAAGQQLNSLVQDFISKSARAPVSGLVEAYDLSRGFKIDQMLETIQERPLLGIGFGVTADLAYLDIKRDPILGLPIGASVEKSVLPLAVLEDVGILGAVFVLVWLWSVVRNAAAKGIAALSIVFVGLMINLGEAILFSPGGMGMLLLIFVSWAAVKPVQSRSRLIKT